MIIKKKWRNVGRLFNKIGSLILNIILGQLVMDNFSTIMCFFSSFIGKIAIKSITKILRNINVIVESSEVAFWLSFKFNLTITQLLKLITN